MSSDHAADVHAYIDGVLNGSIVTGRLQRLAVHRHLDDLKFAGERGFYFDEKMALNAIDFSLCCHHFKGEWAGLPLQLRPEQKFVSWCLFGWRKKANGFRRFRHAQIEKARKGGKSTEAAYFANLLMFADCPLEPAAEGVCVATKKDQAMSVWDMAAQMIRKSPDLMSECRIVGGAQGAHAILLPDGGWFKPLAIDEKAGDSYSIHCLIKDEEHAYRRKHKKMMKALSSGFGARRQPLTITITTYGDDQSEIWQINHDYAVRCLESVITGEIVDDTWFAFIAAVDYPNEYPCFRCRGENCPWCGGTGIIPVDDPWDEKCWPKANPGLPTTPKIEVMRADANEARQKNDTSEFFQKNLNIIVASKQKVIMPEVWASCAGELSDWSTASGVNIAFDLGIVYDLSAVGECASFEMVDDEGQSFTRYEIRAKSFTCEERYETMKSVLIDRWISEGRFHVSPGQAVDLNAVEEYIVERAAEVSPLTIAHDKYAAKQMSQSLSNEHGLNVFGFIQSPWHYDDPIKLFLSLLTQTRMVDGKPIRLLRHDGCPVLAWQASNLIIRRNAQGKRMPDKSDGASKIDAMVAVLMAFAERLYAQDQFPELAYNRGDMFA